MKYIKQFVSSYEYSYIPLMLRMGVLDDSDEGESFRVSRFGDERIFQPDVDMIVELSLYESIMESNIVDRSFFTRMIDVEEYDQDPLKYPAILDRFVTYDDCGDRIWGPLKRLKRNVSREYFMFCPPVFTHEVESRMGDVVTKNISIEYRANDDVYLEEDRICWSPSWVKDNPVCWVDAGYFMPNSLFDILRADLNPLLWHVETIDDPV